MLALESADTFAAGGVVLADQKRFPRYVITDCHAGPCHWVSLPFDVT
jgi:hypothetical protein